MKRRLVLATAAAVCAAFASGCATTGATFQEATASAAAPKPGEGRIYFFRSSSIVGAAMQPDIRLNGQVVGSSKPGGFFFVDRPAGRYVASTATETEKSLTFTLDAGETKYVRSSPSLGVIVGRVVLELEQPEKARAELQSLRQTTLQAQR